MRMEIKDFNGNVVTEFDTYYIAKSLENDSMTEILSDFLNSFSKDFNSGFAIGQLFRNYHRTLQGTLVRWAFGLIVGLATNNIHYDARNEMAIKAGLKVKELLDSGEIDMGYLI